MNNKTHLTLLELKSEIENATDPTTQSRGIVEIIDKFIEREKPISIDEYKRSLNLSYANNLDFTLMGDNFK